MSGVTVSAQAETKNEIENSTKAKIKESSMNDMEKRNLKKEEKERKKKKKIKNSLTAFKSRSNKIQSMFLEYASKEKEKKNQRRMVDNMHVFIHHY